MWCGTCYASSTTPHFHVASLGSKSDKNEKDLDERERLGTAWGKQLRDPTDFCVGGRGDHIMTPFECDLCVFRKLRKSNPKRNSPQDRLLLGVIRRMNLDAFWSRATGTVVQNADRARMGIELSFILGLEGPYEDKGVYPAHDHCGYEIAAVILMHSRKPGRYSGNYT